MQQVTLQIDVLNFDGNSSLPNGRNLPSQPFYNQDCFYSTTAAEK